MYRFLKILAIGALAAMLSACPFDDDDDSPASAQLRVLHGSIDAPNVDVIVDGSTVLTNVPYEAASAYLDVSTNGINVNVNATGTDTTALMLENVDLTPDTPYTVIAANSLASIEAILLDDAATAPASGNLLVRVVHATATAPAVDVYVTAQGADLTDLMPAVSGASYKDASGFLEIPEGTYQIRVTAAGSKDPLFDSGSVALASGAQLTIVALPSNNVISPINLIALTGDAEAPTLAIRDSRAQLRVAHLSPDAPNVDVYVDGAEVLTDVPFKAVSDYLLVSGGSHQIQINPTGTMTSVIDIELDFTARTSSTAAAVNFVASIEPLAIADDLTAPAAGNAHVRVGHASPDAPNVDVLVDDVEVLSDVPFKAVSDYMPIAAGMHNIKVNVVDTTTTVIEADLDFEDGGIYSIFAVNAVASIEPLVVRDH